MCFELGIDRIQSGGVNFIRDKGLGSIGVDNKEQPRIRDGENKADIYKKDKKRERKHHRCGEAELENEANDQGNEQNDKRSNKDEEKSL